VLANNLQQVLWLFGLISLAAFFFPFFKQGIYKQIGFSVTGRSLAFLASIGIGYSVLFLIGEKWGVSLMPFLPSFLGALALFFLLSAIKLPAHLQGLALLGASITFSLCMPSDTSRYALLSASLGLITWKLAEMVYIPDEPDFLDVLPPLTWLIGLFWILTGLPSSAASSSEGVLLAALSSVILLRLFQAPFMFDDKWYLKRLILSTTGGLIMLIVNTKLLMLPDPGGFAWLVGGSLFVSYLFRDFEDKARDKINDPMLIFQYLSMALLIAGVTIVASRMFGTVGFIVAATTTLVARPGSAAHYAGLFFVVRALLQGFIADHVANVTGVNVLHPYVGAVLYAGFVIALVLGIIVRDAQDKWLKLALFLAVGTFAPIAANFFLHAEPAAGLFDATLVGCILFALFAPVLFRSLSGAPGYLLLVPAQMICVGMLGSELISKGNEAVASTKMQMLIAAGIIGAVAPLVIMMLLRMSRDKRIEIS